jgi:hypothetical protein
VVVQDRGAPALRPIREGPRIERSPAAPPWPPERAGPSHLGGATIESCIAGATDFATIRSFIATAKK